jgi:predicted secreted protein
MEAHVIDLDENPSTGYVWEIVNIPSRLTVTSTWIPSEPHRRPPKLPVRVGGGGIRRFVFEGPPGAYAVRLAHRRPWAFGDNALEERTIEFTLDDTPQAAPGYIGAETITEEWAREHGLGPEIDLAKSVLEERRKMLDKRQTTE